MKAAGMGTVQSTTLATVHMPNIVELVHTTSRWLLVFSSITKLGPFIRSFSRTRPTTARSRCLLLFFFPLHLVSHHASLALWQLAFVYSMVTIAVPTVVDTSAWNMPIVRSCTNL
jgi:hypothetical protein